MAGAGVVMEEEVADVVMMYLELCGVAADLVCGPAGDRLAAFGPQHHSLGRGLADTMEGDHYFAIGRNRGSHHWQEFHWTSWRR